MRVLAAENAPKVVQRRAMQRFTLGELAPGLQCVSQNKNRDDGLGMVVAQGPPGELIEDPSPVVRAVLAPGS